VRRERPISAAARNALIEFERGQIIGANRSTIAEIARRVRIGRDAAAATGAPNMAWLLDAIADALDGNFDRIAPERGQ